MAWPGPQEGLGQGGPRLKWAEGRFGSKNDEKMNVLGMEFSIVENLSGLQESIFNLSRGVTIQLIEDRLASNELSSFQAAAEEAIRKHVAEPYFRDSRIRAKCLIWKFTILPGHLERRVNRALHAISANCPPRVLSCFFKTLWNGWVTHERMKALISKRNCILGCGWPDDSIMHYCCCSVYWRFLCAPFPIGLGVNLNRSRDAALMMTTSLTDADYVRLATGLYALFRTVNTMRFSSDALQNPAALLRIYAKRGMDSGSRSFLE